MGKVLVVDDEPEVVRFVKRALESEGHHVLSARDGATGLQIALGERPDLVLLDLVMPGSSGRDMLCALITMDPDAQIIVLSASADIDTRVEVLDAGAVDFLVKPFAVRELLSRVRRHLAHHKLPSRVAATGNGAGGKVSLDGVSLDLRMRSVTVNGRVLPLSQREFLLLEHLMSHAGVVCSREQLLSEVWGYSYAPGTNVVDVYVGRLRHKLLPKNLIQTVRNVGYYIQPS